MADIRLIDAVAYYKELKEEMDYPGRSEEFMIAIDVAIADLADAPTIDSAPVVHGRWKHYHKQNIAVCTNCSFERDLSVNFGKAVSCPNCGAKMDLEVTNNG